MLCENIKKKRYDSANMVQRYEYCNLDCNCLAIYTPAQAAKIMYRKIAPVQLSLANPLDKTMFHNTSDNSEKIAIFMLKPSNVLSRSIAKTAEYSLFGKIDSKEKKNECSTYEHEQETRPTNVNRKRCVRWYSKHIQWYESIDG